MLHSKVICSGFDSFNKRFIDYVFDRLLINLAFLQYIRILAIEIWWFNVEFHIVVIKSK